MPKRIQIRKKWSRQTLPNNSGDENFNFMKRILLIIAFLSASVFSARAQQWAISTNAVDWLNFGTINLEGSVAVSRHVVFDVGAKYNPWNFTFKEKPVMNKERMFYVAGRYYPWFSFDGWYFGAMAGYREYASGGIVKQLTEEGDAYGGGLGVGYTLIIGKNFNINFGAYAWGGKKNYVQYECPVCGRKVDEGSKFFIMPTNITISLTWVFGGNGNSKNHRYHEGMDKKYLEDERYRNQ